MDLQIVMHEDLFIPIQKIIRDSFWFLIYKFNSWFIFIIWNPIILIIYNSTKIQ